ncbi:hypothetical protein [Haloarcula sp. H-GB5]|jgi:hypothetical protein
MYYSIMTFDDNVAPAYLGKIPLVQADDGIRSVQRTGDKGRLVGENRTVEFHWGDRNACEVPLPSTVDSTDPFQLAPMASYYGRPCGPRSEFIKHGPDTVYVYKIESDSDETVSAADLDCIDYRESTDDTDNPHPKKVERWYEWDDNEVPPREDLRGYPNFDDASHVIGFVDGQDMFDPYTHLGVSTAEDGAQAIRNVLDRLDSVPLWSPQATPIKDIRAFNATCVFNVAAPTSTDALA